MTNMPKHCSGRVFYRRMFATTNLSAHDNKNNNDNNNINNNNNNNNHKNIIIIIIIIIKLMKLINENGATIVFVFVCRILL